VYSLQWEAPDEERLIVVVNDAGNQSQCYVKLPFLTPRDHQWRLHEPIDNAHYDRDGNELPARGPYVDLAPWRYHVFKVKKLA